MKFIRDSVHGDLHLNEFEVKLIDTPQIQRLRRIKQLGFTYLVYPGSNHTRFEHSIGTMYLASRLAHNLQLDEDQTKIVRLCAILHDAGHGPFSHVSEGVIDRSHEELTSRLIKKTQIGDLISENYDLNSVLQVINGKGSLGQIISGELDVDRMDYLLRDSYYTGVAYGVIDVERLIYNMILDKDLMLKRKGVQAAESMLLARYFMYPSVYQHHTTRIINAMFRRCLKKLFQKDLVHPHTIYLYDDADIISAARSQEGFIKDMIQRLDNRYLFKTVYSLKLEEISHPEAAFHLDQSQITMIEQEIAQELHISPEQVLVDVPEYPLFDEMSTLVSINGTKTKLGDISSIVVALKKARFNHADLCIYLTPNDAQKSSGFPFRDYIPLD